MIRQKITCLYIMPSDEVLGEDYMDTLSIRGEIEKLIKSLPLSYEDLHEIGKTQWASIKKNIENRFLKINYYTDDLRWGWEVFKEPQFSVTFTDPAFSYFSNLIEDDVIWFVVEDYKNKMWLYEGTKDAIIRKVIPECLNLKEYYLVSKKYEWILCENHHNVACGSGKRIVEKMNKFIGENPEEIITVY
uniref:DUF6756 family protein n=1 Tax=Acetivibrio cellulolyticus TaxID=35830 RepID=UPI0002481BBB|nr:DUF6756 family protein [Acetivibrio cellulolyticus]